MLHEDARLQALVSGGTRGNFCSQYLVTLGADRFLYVFARRARGLSTELPVLSADGGGYGETANGIR